MHTQSEIETFIREMPKAELQVGVESTMEPALKFQLAKRNEIELPYGSYEELRNSYVFPNTQTFLAALYEGCSLLRSEQDFYDLTYRYLKKTSTENNAVYTELSFYPQIHTNREIAFETIIRGIHLAQLNAQKKYGIESKLIMCFEKSESLKSHIQTMSDMSPFRDWIVGIGFAGDGRGVAPVSYKRIIDDARAQGLKVSIRNNLDQEGVMEHIRQCLFDVTIDRLNDSVNCIDDDELTTEIVRRGITQTVCPISTEYGKTTESPRRQNPRFHREIPVMLEKNMKITLNTDGPAYFLSQHMNDIILNTQRAANLSKEQLGTLMLNAFEGSWLDQAKKQQYIDTLQKYLAQHH